MTAVVSRIYYLQQYQLENPNFVIELIELITTDSCT